MKLIKGVEVMEVSGHRWEIQHWDPPPMTYTSDAFAEAMDIRRELVTGRCFINKKGEEIILGATEEVQEIIGLPFEVLENQQEEIENLLSNYYREKQKAKRLQDKLDEYKSMSFWQKLKSLFLGNR